MPAALRSPLLLLLLLPLAACAEAEPESDCADPEGSGWTADRLEHEEDMLDLVNDHRAAGAVCNGVDMPPVPALSSDDLLRCAARGHAVDMGQRDYFDHESPGGVGPSERVDAVGYVWTRVAENIAAGRTDAAGTVQDLIESTSGHCENIMDADVTQAGMGAALVEGSTYSTYWVQVFAAP